MTEVVQLVDGVVSAPGDELDTWLTDSDTGERVRPSAASTATDVDRALAAASRVHEQDEWWGLGFDGRAEVLRRLSKELLATAEGLARADAADTGVLLTTTAELCAGAAAMPAAIGEIAPALLSADADGAWGPVSQRWLPWGPAVVFAPWNAPTSIALSKAAFALAAGAPVILKPSELAQRSAGLIAAAAVAVDLPPGVLQVLHGGTAVGQQLVADPRVAAVSYTGGGAGGRAVATASAPHLRPLDLELSGSNPVVVLDDADLEETADEIVASMLFLNGQWCAGPTRVIAPSATSDRLADLLVDRLEGVLLGRSDDPTSRLGPLAHEGHVADLERDLRGLEHAGATVRRTGQLPAGGGHFFRPAVVTGPAASTHHDEVFGPVVTVQGYDDVDDAVRRANQGELGLAGYVFSATFERAREVGSRLRAGLVSVNRIRPMLSPPTPDAAASMWAGSGMGTIGIAHSLRFFTGARLVS
jgi:phenylacetaldehyde dehydrogenase